MTVKISPKFAVALITLGLTAGLSPVASANNIPVQPTQLAKDKKPVVKGKVLKVDGVTVTVKSGKKGEEKEVAVTTDANTKVTLADGKEGKVADLKEGDAVTVTPDTGTAATIIVAAPKVKK